VVQVDVNMQTSQKIDAIRNERFYFRKNVFSGQYKFVFWFLNGVFTHFQDDDDEYELMTIDEIINGKVQFDL
jgi:glutamate--cysteine ligase catalytic subunit